MNTRTAQVPFSRTLSAPRGAEPLASIAAALFRWTSLRIANARQRREEQRGLNEMWALAAQSEKSQPSLSAELYAAARRYESSDDGR
jgi:hypothetical protein